jgi:16S rRNA (uracil1498-N3)-methyltransferase
VSTPPLFLADPLPDGESFVLSGPEGHHAAAVRRMRAGEALLLSDGRGAVASCVVAGAAGPDALRLRVDRRWSEPQPALRVVLAQALLKGDRGELAVELATEAGVDAVVPWRAERCVARWDGGVRGARALARWRAAAREAGKQARRAWLPEVAVPVSTDELAARVAAADAAVVLDASTEVSLGELPLPSGGELLLVVGPEGGIGDAELSVLVSAGAAAARLGPTVLRSSTAGVVALAALGVLTDRWAHGLRPKE